MQVKFTLNEDDVRAVLRAFASRLIRHMAPGSPMNPKILLHDVPHAVTIDVDISAGEDECD